MIVLTENEKKEELITRASTPTRNNAGEVRWKKWTLKSDRIERRRCQDERYSARKVDEGVSWGSSEDGVRRRHVIA